MKTRNELGTGHVRRYLLALGIAMLLALGAALPAFAVEGPAGEDEVTFQPQVVGGDPVPDGKYKFVAALRDVTRGNSAYQQQFCGGTLIDRNSVLTAAHCLETVTAAQLRVTVGRTVLNSDQGQTRRVEAIYRHPKYTSSLISFRYDAAVLELSSRIRNISAVKIPETTVNKFEESEGVAKVAGWGSTTKQPSNKDPNYPNRMQEAEVPIVSDREAKRAYDSDYAPALMLAAGEGGKDTCQGDSGGPIFVQKRTERFFQIGITSFGNGCGAEGFPGVYTEANAENIRPFIYRAAGK